MTLHLVMLIRENHETDTFHLSPFKVCTSEEQVLETRVKEVTRFAVVLVEENRPFDFDGLGDSWMKDEKVDGMQFIFYDKRNTDG